MKKGKIGAIVVGVVIIAGLLCIYKCTEKVPAGYVGVLYNMSGGVDGEVLTQGWHLVSPTKKTTLYSTAIEQGYLSKNEEEGEKNDESFSIPTSDGKTINVDLEFSYHFDAEKVADTFVKFKGQSGKTIEDTFIKGKMKAWAGEVSAKYTVIQVFGSERAELNTAMKDYIADKFAKYGIVIDTVNFTRIDTDKETAAAIQKKVTAQQTQELANIEAKTAKIQAEKDKSVALIAAEQEKEKASIEAEQALIKAEGQANATKIKAQAEAQANREIAKSLTPELIEKQKIEKWNGDVPKVQGSTSTTPIVDMRE